MDLHFHCFFVTCLDRAYTYEEFLHRLSICLSFVDLGSKVNGRLQATQVLFENSFWVDASLTLFACIGLCFKHIIKHSELRVFCQFMFTFLYQKYITSHLIPDISSLYTLIIQKKRPR